MILFVVFIKFFKSHIPSPTKINDYVIYNHYAHKATYIITRVFIA